MPTRRQYLSLTTATITAGLAGCAGRTGTTPAATTSPDTRDSTTSTATATAAATSTEDSTTTAAPATVRASLGDVVRGEQFELEVATVQRGVTLDGYEAAPDADIVAVSLTVRSTSQADGAASPLRAVVLRDDSTFIYDSVADKTANPVTIDESIPSGETAHLTIPFEVRTAARGLELLCDVTDEAFGATAMVVFDLGTAAARSSDST